MTFRYIALGRTLLTKHLFLIFPLSFRRELERTFPTFQWSIEAEISFSASPKAQSLRSVPNICENQSLY